MSHIAELKTQVEFKNLEILKEAIAEIGASLTDHYLDYYGRSIKCDLALKHKELPRGIGFEKQGDRYIVKADTYGYVSQADRILKELQQKYVSKCYQKALQRNGWSNIKIERKQSGEIHIIAMRW